MIEQASTLELVLLGAAMASPSALERVLARLDDGTIVHMRIGTILSGLRRQDDKPLRDFLLRLGVPVPPGTRAADAVADAVKLDALTRRKHRLAQELMDASKLMNYEQYVEFVKTKLG